MNKLTLLLTFFLAMTLAPLLRASLADTPAETTIESDERRDAEAELYERGTDAIDDEEWSRAIDIFRKVVAMNGKRTDGALYWLAYAQTKAGRGGEALETIAALVRTRPKSRWTKDAKALEMDIKQTSGQHVDPANVNDEELKLIAIQGLLSTSPERALPLLQKIVDGPYSRRVKEQALFVLSQSPSDSAAQLIASIARGTAHPELQTEAIKYLGVAGRRHIGLLGEVYRSTNSVEVKKEILRAYMVAGARGPISVAAHSEKDPHLRAEAVRQLGVMGGTSELQELYRAETSPEVKKIIIESIFVGGGSDALLEIARGEPDDQLRATAVRTLGLMGQERTASMLVSFYRNDTNKKVRRAALEGLFVQNNARALVDLAKQEKDPQWKREIVQKLSVMNSKDATDYLTSLLE